MGRRCFTLSTELLLDALDLHDRVTVLDVRFEPEYGRVVLYVEDPATERLFVGVKPMEEPLKWRSR